MELRGTGLKAKPLRRQATALKHARQATAAGVGAPRDVKTNDNVAVAPALSRRGIKGVVKKNGLSKLEPMPVNGHSNAKLDDKRRLPIVEEAQLLLGVPSDDALGHTGQVRVKFNHYNKLFAVHNGVLRWCLIDDEYCLSFVYKGNFRRDLHIIPLPEIQPESKINKQQSFVSKLDWPRAIRDEMGIYFLSIDTTR